MSNVTSALRATAGDNILAGRYVPRKSPAALVTSSRRTIRISGAIEAQRLPYAVAEPPRPSSILSVCAARPRLIRLHFGHISGRWPACSGTHLTCPNLSPRLSAVGTVFELGKNLAVYAARNAEKKCVTTSSILLQATMLHLALCLAYRPGDIDSFWSSARRGVPRIFSCKAAAPVRQYDVQRIESGLSTSSWSPSVEPR